jgi:phosphatidylinositol glycan class S
MDIRQESWHRVPILLSFWLIVLIGLPFWWYTTLVYRAELPADDIIALSAARPSLEFRFPVKLVFHLGADQKELQFPQLNEEEYLNELSDKNGSYFYKNLLRLEVATSNELQGRNFGSVEEISQYLEEMSDLKEDYEFHVIEASAFRLSNSKSVYMTKSRLGVVLVDSFSSSSLLTTLQKLAAATLHLDRGAELVDSFYSLKLLPKYQFTFNLLIADDRKLYWPIKNALNSKEILTAAYLKKFLKKIAIVSEISVDSQILHFSSLKVLPKKKENYFYLEHGDLQHFVNAAEWNIEAPVISTQNVHLCAFIPEEAFAPLHVVDDSMNLAKSNSFIFPQWGGVVIINPQPSQDSLSADQMETVMGMFLQHLRSLFGVPRISNRSFMGYEISYEHSEEGITAMEFDLLMRDKTVKSLMGSISTLHSLVRLVESIPNMTVPDDIQLAVRNSLKLINEVEIF